MATAAQKKKAQAAANLKASYGFVAMLAKAVPEVGRLMQRAVREKWTSDRFQMEVANTHWWKKTPAQTRQWVTQKVADPASASQALKSGGANLSQIAGEMGLPISASKAQELWLYGQLHGYDEQTTRGLIFRHLESHGGLPADGEASGVYGSMLNRARELAASYGYSPADLDRQVRIAAGSGLEFGATGENTLSGFETRLKNYAKSKYAAFADRIDAGETVRDIAQPYVDTYAQILEVNPQDVGLDDQLLQKALQGRPAEAGKPPAGVPVWQFEQDLRKDPRWGKTRNANAAAADVLTTVGRAFGMIGS